MNPKLFHTYSSPTIFINGQRLWRQKKRQDNEHQRRNVEAQDSGPGRFGPGEPPGPHAAGLGGGRAFRRPRQAAGAAPRAEAAAPLLPRGAAEASSNRQHDAAAGAVGGAHDRQGPPGELDAVAEIGFRHIGAEGCPRRRTQGKAAPAQGRGREANS